ncbi:hypothetical protein LIA77_00939 [Sarocladium implicatum]|nr:hypothetical protein LIA77_00939 [Sarocladium implicatum]
MGHYSESNAAFAHPLRKTIIITFIPALALCVPASVINYSPVPGLGLIPLAGSAILSIVTLAIARKARKKRARSSNEDGGGDDDDDDNVHPPFLLSPVALFIYDVMLATFIMTVLIPTWSTYHRYEAMLTAYATMPLLVAFLAHIYLALLALWQAFHHAFRSTYRTHCPNCDARLQDPQPALPWWERSQRDRRTTRRNGLYSLLDPADETAERYQDDAETGVSARKNLGAPAEQGKGGAAVQETSLNPSADE